MVCGGFDTYLYAKPVMRNVRITQGCEMNKLLIAALALFAIPAFAADMPVKAPIQRAPIFYGGSGFYCGAGLGGEATKVAATGVVATYEAGGLMNFNCGYTMAIANDRFLAFQANYSYANTNNKTVCPVGVDCEVGNKQSGDIKVMYGAPISALSAIFSNAATGFPALPPIPPGAINTTMHPYISAGARIVQDRALLTGIVDQKKTKVKGLLGVGAIYQTNSNTTINTFADWTFGSGKFLIQPGTEIEVGSTFRFGVIVNYGMGG